MSSLACSRVGPRFENSSTTGGGDGRDREAYHGEGRQRRTGRWPMIVSVIVDLSSAEHGGDVRCQYVG